MEYEKIRVGMMVLVEAEVVQVMQEIIKYPIEVKLVHGFLKPEEVRLLKVDEPEEEIENPK